MNREELYEMLIDYAEGTLDSSRTLIIEDELKKSASLRDELALLRSTFEKLQNAQEQDVPSYYYTNFLPRLREKLEQKKSSAAFVLPLWVQKLTMPVAAVAVIISMIGLYNILMPDDSEQSISSIVQAVDQVEVEQLITNDTPFGTTSGLTSTPTSLRNSQILADELIASSTLYDNVVYDAQILSQLEEQDVEWIVRQLGSGKVQ